MNINDWIGTAGVALILIAYFCSTFKWIDGQGSLYYLLNLTGAALACYASYRINYLPFVILEGVWTIVSVAGLIKSLGTANQSQV